MCICSLVKCLIDELIIFVFAIGLLV